MKAKSMKRFKCAQCGELKDTAFYPSMSDYVYKSKCNGETLYFCGHNCKEAWLREREKEKQLNKQIRNEMREQGKSYTKEEATAKALEMYLNGATLKFIEKALGRTAPTIRSYLRACGYQWDNATQKYVKVVNDG